MEFVFLIGFVISGGIAANYLAPKSVVRALLWKQTNDIKQLFVAILYGLSSLFLVSVMFYYFIQPFLNSKF